MKDSIIQLKDLKKWTKYYQKNGGYNFSQKLKKEYKINCSPNFISKFFKDRENFVIHKFEQFEQIENIKLKKGDKIEFIATCEKAIKGKIQKKKQIIKEMTKTKERVVNIHFDGSKIDTLRQISHTDKMLRLLKFNERFGAGGRNNYLFACAKYLQDSGMMDNEVVNEVLWINSQGDGISEEEIKQTIFKSLRIYI